mmetsp:Transcript_20195/g.43892  ORF Transcript_20195/g.43892 Transcript_20195/m.43892 type:complete len:809 (-) Transcript_20195:209-2635(-)
MPARLRSINSSQHAPRQQQRNSSQNNRKSVSLALAGLASRRKNASSSRRKQLSSKAEQVLGDGDLSDGDRYKQDKKNNAANVTTSSAAADRNNEHAGLSYNVQSANINDAAAHDDSSFDFFESTFPDDESPPKVQPKKLNTTSSAAIATSAANEKQPHHGGNNNTNDDINEDETIRAGNEALLFIYGENPNLYTNVFQLAPSACTNSELIQTSYNNQMSRLSLAIECPDQEELKEAAVACGMKREHWFLHPKNFCEIKLDAVQRAYDIVMEKEQDPVVDNNSRNQDFDGLWKKFDDDFWGTEDTNTETTKAETEEGTIDDSSEEFWSEDSFAKSLVAMKNDTENDMDGDNGHDDENGASSVTDGYLEADGYNENDDDGSVVYGSHGDYSYDCEDENEADHYEGNDDNPHEEDDSSSALEYSCHSGDETNALEYSYHSGDEYNEQEEQEGEEASDEEEGEEDEEEEGDDEYNDNATFYAAAIIPNKKNQQPQYSPTDPMEFDMLIRDSLPNDDYFNQLSLSPGSPDAAKSEEVFNPFNLNDEQNNGNTVLSGNDFLEHVIEESESMQFVCLLPGRDDDSDSGSDQESVSTNGSKDTHGTDGSTDSIAFSESVTTNNNRDDIVFNNYLQNDDYSQDETLDSKIGVDPDGPNMSMDDEEEEDKEDLEIETFLSIASTFGAMNSAASRSVTEDCIQSHVSNSAEGEDDRSSCSSNKTGDDRSLCSSNKTGETDDDGIDCFATEEEEGRAVRFNLSTIEFEYDNEKTASQGGGGSNNSHCCVYPCLDSCIDVVGESIDDTISSVEIFCGLSSR